MDKIDGLFPTFTKKTGNLAKPDQSFSGAIRRPFSRRTAQIREKHSGDGQERVWRWMPSVREERGEASLEESLRRNSSAS